jgi:hypothetical protein
LAGGEVEIEVCCPSCGEPLAVWIDLDGGTRQQYVEDCAVCCRPMQVDVALDENGDPAVAVRTLDE